MVVAMPVTLKLPDSPRLAAMVVHTRALLLKTRRPEAVRVCYGVEDQTGLPGNPDALEAALPPNHVADFEDATRLGRLTDLLRAEVRTEDAFRSMFGSDPVFLHALAVARDAAKWRGDPRTRPPVLITGDSGSGKELLARAIHAASGLKGKFVAVHCAGMTLELLEDALFGHAEGSYTGARASRRGLVDVARDGTLFIDEVADLPPQAQVALLRFLNDQKYRPIGQDEEEQANVRIVAATWQDLGELVDDGKFREDLLNRIAGIQIYLPSLRERSAELLELADEIAHDAGVEADVALDPEARLAVRTTKWPGGLRELSMEIREAARRSEKGTIRLEHLAPERVVRFHRNPTGIRVAAQCLAWSPGGRVPSDEEVCERLRVRLPSLVGDSTGVEASGQLLFVSKVRDAFRGDASTHELLASLIALNERHRLHLWEVAALHAIRDHVTGAARRLVLDRLADLGREQARREAEMVELSNRAATKLPGMVQITQFVYALPGLSEHKREELFTGFARFIALFMRLLPGFVSLGLRRLFGNPLDDLLMDTFDEVDPSNPFEAHVLDPADRPAEHWIWLAEHSPSMAHATRVSGYAKNTVAKYFNKHSLAVSRNGDAAVRD